LATVLSVLLAAVVAEQTRGGERRRVEQVILLKGDEVRSEHVLRVAPDAATLVLFDTPIVRESVDTRALASFERAEVADSSLVLRPSVELSPEQPLRLTVRFAGSRAPRQVELVLTSVKGVVDTQVEVLRERKSEAHLAAELARLRGQCAVTEAGLAPLRARCARAGLAGLFVSGEMDPEKGVKAYRPVEEPVTLGVSPGPQATVYRTGDTVMVGMKLANPSGHAPWVAGPARLVRLDTRGEPLGEIRLLPVVMEPERVTPGESALLAVQWQEPPGAPAVAVRLEVVDAGGRGVRWERLELQPLAMEGPGTSRGRRVGP
jgi:uncharacterized protein (TIGR02268 family)